MKSTMFVAFALAAFVQLAPVSMTAVSAQVAPEQPTEDLSRARQILQWSETQLGALDRTLAVIEQDASKLQGDARIAAEGALKDLRDGRDAYRSRLLAAADGAQDWTVEQYRQAQEQAVKDWRAIQATSWSYLEATKADLATRQAVLDAGIEAQRSAWATSVAELRVDAARLGDERRAAIGARIDALQAQAAAARESYGRLKDASGAAWEATVNGYGEAQAVFGRTYTEIRKLIEDAAR